MTLVRNPEKITWWRQHRSRHELTLMRDSGYASTVIVDGFRDLTEVLDLLAPAVTLLVTSEITCDAFGLIYSSCWRDVIVIRRLVTNVDSH